MLRVTMEYRPVAKDQIVRLRDRIRGNKNEYRDLQEKIGKKELAFMGHGGLCKDCKECVYPHCPFGKGL